MEPVGTVRAGNLLFLLALLCMALVTNACTRRPMLVCHSNYFHAMDRAAIEEEIMFLETAIDRDLENTEKSEAYFYLALLYAHYNNPAPDYPLSLIMFDKYLSFNPDTPKKEEALYMKTLVQELVENDKERALIKNEAQRLKQLNAELKDNNEKLAVENQNSMNTIEKLVVENQNSTDAIEKLKLLELSLELRRLNFK